MDLDLLPDEIAVCRLSPTSAVPDWAWTGAIASVTRTADELSIVCDWDAPPPDARAEGPWRALTVRGPLAFELTGIAAALTAPLAEAGVTLFLIATYDTDHLLVRTHTLGRAVAALEGAGHKVHAG